MAGKRHHASMMIGSTPNLWSPSSALLLPVSGIVGLIIVAIGVDKTPKDSS
jgi:hypothetical protein